MKTYYELLGVPHDAPAGEIKQAFRRAISKYHPDKVQHLGEEFQQLAQERASELTTAYKTLIDDARRAEYDATLVAGYGLRATGYGPDLAEGPKRTSPRADDQGPEPGDNAERAGFRADNGAGARRGTENHPNEPGPVDDLRHDRDLLLKRAVLARADQLLRQALPESEPSTLPGFDLGFYSKPRRLFGRSQPWVLARFVPDLNSALAHDVWTQACRGSDSRQVPVCVFLLASQLPPPRELATLVSANGRTPRGHHSITVVPVDVRDWRPWVPVGADAGIRALARRLQAPASAP